MKAIIIAAGLGKRCRPHTYKVPKCLLSINGKSILEHQLQSLRVNDVTDIALIRGYLAQKITGRGIRYYDNLNYEHNNVLSSLMVAEQELDSDCIVSYADILYTAEVIRAAVRSSADLAVIVDTAWRNRYVGRKLHPLTEAEKVISDGQGRVLSIGKHLDDTEEVTGEFIGCMRLSQNGCGIIRESFHEAKNQYSPRGFQQSKSFEQAYLTDILQEMVDKGVNIDIIPIQKNWIEVDTVEDYEYAKAEFKGYQG